MSESRRDLIQQFLRDAGWPDAQIHPLAGDASNRRYLRLEQGGMEAVLMDAPPEKGEDCRPFVAMTEWLRQADLSAPKVFAMDLEEGFLLLEDLGDNLFARHVMQHPDEEMDIYAEAIRVLVHLAEITPPRTIGSGAAEIALPFYDRTVLLREAALVSEWWMPAATGHQTAPDLAEEYTELIRQAVSTVEASRDVVVLRDYHAENLLWCPDRTGRAQVGLLDYQDALNGHAAYDLVSLLEDARRDTNADMREALMRLYLDLRPELDSDQFRRDYAVLGAQRNLKIIGIFARLALRDGKPGYLDLIPRVWDHLQNDLADPALSRLKAWVDSHVPVPDAARLTKAKANAEAAQ